MPTSPTSPYQPSPVTEAFAQITAGADPWIAIGDFLDDWRRCVSMEQRQELVATPITVVRQEDMHLQRWAAFCAAMVEQLCLEAGLTAPAWVLLPQYILAEPWYLYRGTQPEWRAWQEAASPTPFKTRHICGGDGILARA